MKTPIVYMNAKLIMESNIIILVNATEDVLHLATRETKMCVFVKTCNSVHASQRERERERERETETDRDRGPTT